jgi:hypothetical protein
VSTTLIDRTLPAAARLSQLIIDADKDWLKYNITNFGPGGVDLYSLLTSHANRHSATGADPLPDGALTPSKLSYLETDVPILWLIMLYKCDACAVTGNTDTTCYYLPVSIADKAVEGVGQSGDNTPLVTGRLQNADNEYNCLEYTPSSAGDFALVKTAAGSNTTLAYEAVDIANHLKQRIKLSISGTTLKGFREDLTTPKISATDTAYASGYWGGGGRYGGAAGVTCWLRAPASPAPKVLAFYEVPIIGSGTIDDPFRAQLPELLEVPTSAELDAYPPALKAAIQANKDGKVNRLALTHSALIPTDPTTGKPLYSTCIVRVFEQPDRQPHMWKIPEVLARLETQTAIPIRKLDVTQAIARAKEMDARLSDFDFYAMPSPSDEEIRKYIEWRKTVFGVETRWEDARHYLESEKGWT